MKKEIYPFADHTSEYDDYGNLVLIYETFVRIKRFEVWFEIRFVQKHIITPPFNEIEVAFQTMQFLTRANIEVEKLKLYYVPIQEYDVVARDQDDWKVHFGKRIKHEV